MTPLPPGFVRTHLASVASTNDHARRLAEADAADGTIVTADRQTAGRGRRGRRWESPPGNLHATMVLRPSRPLAEAVQVGFVAAVALREGIESLLPGAAPVACKWPNDILIGGRKVSGLLLEAGPLTAQAPAWLLLGFGVNVASVPEAAAHAATSLASEGASATAGAVLAAFLGRFATWRSRWEAGGFEPVRRDWREHAHGLGGPIAVRLDGGTLRGTFLDIDGDGAMVLRMPEGDRRVTYGDVFSAAA